MPIRVLAASPAPGSSPSDTAANSSAGEGIFTEMDSTVEMLGADPTVCPIEEVDDDSEIVLLLSAAAVLGSDTEVELSS